MVTKYTSPSAYSFRFMAMYMAGTKKILLMTSNMMLMREKAGIVFEISVQSHPV